jgi:basic amino acid/polyamine antiporter, APA family
MSLFRTKSLDNLLKAASDNTGLKRTLGPVNLIALGIGAIIGAGLFVRTANAAGTCAGPAVTISFIVAAVACALAGLCYAEFASTIPISGSAYAYAYVTMGELVAWIIGWALIMEYALGAATVAIAWSEYLNKFLELFFEKKISYAFCHSPFEVDPDTLQRGIVNLPALFILALLTVVLIRGIKESAILNGILVALKLAVVFLFIGLGWQFINSKNYDPYFIPADQPNLVVKQKDNSTKEITKYQEWNRHGWGGVLGGAAIVFFAFIGFDAVSTTAQEAKKPARDMPVGILGSLVICTILYVLFGHVLTGVANWKEFADPSKGGEASVPYTVTNFMPGYEGLAKGVTVAILAGFSSVILVMLMGQSRVFYSMANDGLLPKVFSEIHPTFKTPVKSNILIFIFVSIFGGFVPASVAGDMTSFGTLLAFVLVSIGVLILRKQSPNLHRPFKTPLVWIVAPLGAIFCTAMIVALDILTLSVAIGWMVFGLLIYFLYGIRNSKLQKEA